jgi:hypothetical protein
MPCCKAKRRLCVLYSAPLGCLFTLLKSSEKVGLSRMQSRTIPGQIDQAMPSEVSSVCHAREIVSSAADAEITPRSSEVRHKCQNNLTKSDKKGRAAEGTFVQKDIHNLILLVRHRFQVRLPFEMSCYSRFMSQSGKWVRCIQVPLSMKIR